MKAGELSNLIQAETVCVLSGKGLGQRSIRDESFHEKLMNRWPEEKGQVFVNASGITVDATVDATNDTVFFIDEEDTAEELSLTEPTDPWACGHEEGTAEELIVEHACLCGRLLAESGVCFVCSATLSSQ